MSGPKADYLIVGNSVAAIGAVEAIRELDRKGSIVLVSDEDSPAYSRPLISQYLTGEKDLEGILYRPRDFYHRMDVNAILGVRVTGVNYPGRAVSTSRGDEIHYDRLLLATGARPALPPIPGIDLPGVFTFTALADAVRIKEYLARARDVVIIGGGLIGLQAAEALAKLSRKVRIVEFMPRILSPVLDQAASEVVSRLFLENGVDILTGRAASEIVASAAGSAGAVVLKDGTVLPCDMAIVAAGVSPRIDLARADAGGSGSHPATGRGILVNERMETTVPDVYAAGDVATGMDLLTGETRAIPIWLNAYLQGRVAGLNMAGKPVAFRGGLAMNAFHFFGMPVVSAGIFDPPKESEPGTRWEILYELKPDVRFYRKLVLRDNRAVGMIGIGAGVERAGVIVGCIANQIDCESFKMGLLKDPGIGLFPGPIRRSMMLGEIGAGWWQRSKEAGVA